MNRSLAYVSDLVSNAGECRAETRRAHLGQLDWNDTPSTLHAELQPKRAHGEPAEAIGEDPERDEYTSEHTEDDYGESATDELRNGASNATTAVR